MTRRNCQPSQPADLNDYVLALVHYSSNQFKLLSCSRKILTLAHMDSCVAYYEPFEGFVNAATYWAHEWKDSYNRVDRVYHLSPENIEIFGRFALSRDGEFPAAGHCYNLIPYNTLPRIGVVGIVVHPEDEKLFNAATAGECRVLVTKRGLTARNWQGMWEFPGGALEAEDESLEAAVRREINEEVNLGLRWVDSWQPHVLEVYDNDAMQRWIILCYWACADSADVVMLEGKVSEYQWLKGCSDNDELYQLDLCPPAKQLLDIMF